MNDHLEQNLKLQKFHDKICSLQTKEEVISFFKSFLEKEGYVVRDQFEEKEITLIKTLLKDLTARAGWTQSNEDYLTKQLKIKIK